MKILSKQNFNQNESKNFVVDNLSSAPSNPILGQVYYNTQNERAYVCIKSGETPEWADLSLQEEISIGGEEPNGRDIKIWINPEDIASSSDYGSLPIGSIIPYSGTTAPEGYSICDGKELNRETYKELFSIIGTTFGNGDNSTTFNLPNLAGRISVGLDSSDTNFDIIGKTGGGNYEKRVKISSVSYGAFEGTSIPYNGQILISTVKNTETSAQTLESNGIDFKQPYIVLNYIIKIYGEAMLTGDVIDSLEGDSSYNAPSIHAVNTKIKELEAYSSTAINEGSEITLDPNPNSNYNPIDIQIEGKSEQATTKGTNLIGLDNNQYKVDLKIGDKICVTNNGTTQLNLNLYTNYGDTARNDYFTIYANSKRIVSVLKDAKAIAWGGTIEGLVWVNKGEEQLPYEEYTGGQPSPSPDYPQEIKSVEGIENLFDKNKYINLTSNGITATITKDYINVKGTATANAFLTWQLPKIIKSGTVVTMSANNNEVSTSTNTYLRLCYDELGTEDYISRVPLNIKNNSKTFTTTHDDDYLQIRVNRGDVLDINLKIQIEKGSIAHDYVPHGHWLTVTNTGKNLCNGINQKYYLNIAVNLGGLATGNSGLVIPVNGKTKFTISTNIIQERYRVACINNLLQEEKSTTTAYNGVNKDGTNASITIDTTGYKYLVVNATDLTQIQVEKGSTATEYEPYKETSTLIDMNKPNLFDKDNANILHLYPGKTFLSNNNYNSICIEIKPNTTYTLISSNHYSDGLAIGTSKEYPISGGTVTNKTSVAKTKNNVTITSGENDKYLLAYIKWTGTLTEEILNGIKIYEGIGTDDYYELCSIGDTKGILTIQNGQATINKRIGKYIITSVMGTRTNSSGETLYQATLVELKDMKVGNWSKGYCDKYKVGNLVKENNVIRFGANDKHIFLYTDDENFATTESANTYLSNNPVTVYYELAEPQTINLGKITPLKLLEGTNNITTNDELQPNMKIEYYTDVMGNPGVIPDYDGLPVGSEIDYDGTEIPDGFVQVTDPKAYSTEEHVVGTWTDGRPVYQKCFSATNLATGLISIKHNISNLDILVNGYGSFVRNDNVKGVIPYISTTDIAYNFAINDINATTLYLTVGTKLTGSSLGIKNAYIILEYTKTTD